ncbi:cupin domain-containing protein [Nonomuraea longicatena]|uniref:Cupin type-2 domain-containing protein n=1 Tax=Nonomuraea longicatena TaxID=83682 RepID=A0ABN1QKC3_9ACTN
MPVLVPATPRTALPQVVSISAGPADVSELNRIVRSGVRSYNEQFDEDAHLDEVIPKPWGHEYRAYVDDFFDFWTLHLEPAHETSMHVHPRKLTYLLCLAGRGVTATLNGDVGVSAGSILRIAPGAFHLTRNTGGEQLVLIEVEAPRNKLDLIRLADGYNRAGTSYESGSRPAEHPMRKVPYLPHARMRPSTPDGRFAFEIRTGMDVFYRRRDADLFYVPLCLSGVVLSDVEILTSLPGDGRRPNPDNYYLSITRNH